MEELKAMEQVWTILSGLKTLEERERVVSWLQMHLGQERTAMMNRYHGSGALIGQQAVLSPPPTSPQTA
jgi:hypothetical protein